MGRGLNNEPEVSIARLLRIRYSSDDHDGLFKRRNELATWFALVSPERSARLYERLVKKVNHDELSVLFWKLSEETRLQMLGILKKKTEQHRNTRKSTPKRSTQTDVPTTAGSNDARYIDNIIHRLRAPALGGYYVEWVENRKTYTFNLPEKEIHRKRDNYPLELRKIYPDRRSALQAIRDEHTNRPFTKGPGFRLYTFYLGPHNIILPTIFTPDSTPKILDAIEKADRKLERVVDEDLETGRYVSQSFVNNYNPIPMTEVNAKGDLEISSNPIDMAPRLKKRRPRSSPKKQDYRIRWVNLKKRFKIIFDRYKFRKRWIKGKHTADDYEQGFNVIVPKIARDVSNKKVKVDVPGKTGYQSRSTLVTNRLKYQKTRRGDILKRNPDATMEVVEKAQDGTHIVKEVHFFEATTQNDFKSATGSLGHKQRQISGTLWLSSEIPRKGYSKNTKFYYHIVAPEKPTQNTIDFLYSVLDEVPNLEITWIVVN